MMNRFAPVVVVMLFFSLDVGGQETSWVRLRPASDSHLEVTDERGAQGFAARNTLGGLGLETRATPQGVFIQLKIEGHTSSGKPGTPGLPVITRLIRVPHDAEIQVQITGYDEQRISLKDQGAGQPLFPAQPPVVKSGVDTLPPFYYKPQAYQASRFLGQEMVRVEPLGFLRQTRLARLTIAPVQYHPVRKELKIFNNLQFEVHFIPSANHKTQPQVPSTNPYFTRLQDQTLNASLSKDKGFIRESPLTYAIISPPGYRPTLKPFVRWKQRKGFHVLEAYTDSIGGSPEQIRQFLMDAYHHPAVSPPSFVLLVGDVEQIPSWEGKAGSHLTDFYYGEYTDDWLPDAFYGRLPARDTSELSAMLNKSLEYEKYTLADPSYLEDALLVAGDDENYEDTYANGQINYATSYYFNGAHGFRAHAYLQDPEGGNLAVQDSIIHHINRGVGFATYTAHCSPSGWSQPGFNTSHIATLEQNGKYGLWISNCCETGSFGRDNSFTEAALRGSGNGAIGAIGASDDTYWDEDYWWSVGLTSSISPQPSYESSSLGLYDRIFHSHGEDTSEWYVTQGSMMAAGNLAVETSASSRNHYYWEIYHLMGDPALMPYLGIPQSLLVSLDREVLRMGDGSLVVNTEPYAYAALSKEGKLLDATYADARGEAELSFPELPAPGMAELVVTAQNRRPHMQEIVISPNNQPYIVPHQVLFNDSTGNGNGHPDFGETISLAVTLKNVSDSMDAFEVSDSLVQNDPYVFLSDSVEWYGNLPAGQQISKKKAFVLNVSDSVPDQHEVSMEMHIKGKDMNDSVYTWKSNRRVVLNAPVLRVGEEVWVDDQEGGNGLLDPGETGILHFVLENKGHAPLDSIRHRLLKVNEKDPYEVLDTLQATPLLEAGARDTLTFRLRASDSAAAGSLVQIQITSAGGRQAQYSTTALRRFMIGPTPAYTIDQTDTVRTCFARFYDSGGPEEAYSNNENYTLTFIPPKKDHLVQADFELFDVEIDYDWLKIYDGTSTEDSLLGDFDGANPPGIIKPENHTGALTFQFTSDYSVTRAGWDALISCLRRYQVTFNVNVSAGMPEDIYVVFAGDTLPTDSSGRAGFTATQGSWHYSVHARGYHTLQGNLKVSSDRVVDLTLSEILVDVTFSLAEKNASSTLEGSVVLDGETRHTQGGMCTFSDVGASTSHNYTARAEGYHSISGNIRTQFDTTVHLNMERTLYPLTVWTCDGDSTSIEGVDLRIDKIQRFTDTAGRAVFELPMGRYVLYASRKGYHSLEKSIVVNDTLNLALRLLKLHHVRFIVKDTGEEPIEGAGISIDTFALQTDTAGLAAVFLTKGVYSYSITAEGYNEYQSEITLEQDRSLDIMMEPKSSGLEGDLLQGITIFPNPARDIIYIRNATGNRQVYLQILELTGKVLHDCTLKANLTQIDLSSYPPGFYLVRIQSGQDLATRKIILQ